ncbi:MAG: 3D domain-containing protein [Negativicutes bacterium]|nr:3D domain-containing protein [Negativicutes bacterium]
MHQMSRRIKRRYKKLAAALAGAACLSAAVIHGVPVGAHLPGPAAKPLGTRQGTAIGRSTQENPLTPAELAVEAQSAAPLTGPDNPSTRQAASEADAERVIEMTATAYAPGPHDNDQWGSKTHLGTEVRPGVIAVDPRVIPLGSRVMIKYPDGHTEHAVAEDTGGAIKGSRIDVARWTVAEANRFGIKPVRVYVLKTPAERNDSVV